MDRLKTAFIVVLVSVVLALLAAPVGILYLVEPNRQWSVVVVVFFALLATWIMAVTPGIKLDTIFIAMSAYMAVLVTFLANFQGGSVA